MPAFEILRRQLDEALNSSTFTFAHKHTTLPLDKINLLLLCLICRSGMSNDPATADWQKSFSQTVNSSCFLIVYHSGNTRELDKPVQALNLRTFFLPHRIQANYFDPASSPFCLTCCNQNLAGNLKVIQTYRRFPHRAYLEGNARTTQKPVGRHIF